MDIFIRGLLWVVLYILTLPIRIVFVILVITPMWWVMVIKGVLGGYCTIKECWDITKSSMYSTLKREIKWVKTGKLTSKEES